MNHHGYRRVLLCLRAQPSLSSVCRPPASDSPAGHGCTSTVLRALPPHVPGRFVPRCVIGNSPPTPGAIAPHHAAQRMRCRPTRVSSLRGDAGAHWPASRSTTRLSSKLSPDKNRRNACHGATPYLKRDSDPRRLSSQGTGLHASAGAGGVMPPPACAAPRHSTCRGRVTSLQRYQSAVGKRLRHQNAASTVCAYRHERASLTA